MRDKDFIRDLQYFQERLYSALRVPKKYIVYGDDILTNKEKHPSIKK